MMIADKFVAAKISELMIRQGKELNESVGMVKSSCSEEEFVIYQKAIGKIMGCILLDVMNPLYKMHPELKPKKLL